MCLIPTDVCITQREGRDRTAAETECESHSSPEARSGGTCTGHPPCEGQLIKCLPLLGTEGLLQAPISVLILLSCNCFLGLPNPEIRNRAYIQHLMWVWGFTNIRWCRKEKDVFHIYLLTHTHTHRSKVKVCMCIPGGNHLHSLVFFTWDKKPGREHARGTEEQSSGWGGSFFNAWSCSFPHSHSASVKSKCDYNLKYRPNKLNGFQVDCPLFFRPTIMHVNLNDYLKNIWDKRGK